MQEKLKKLRDEIDKIDEELLRLINERLSLAQEIGKLKRSVGEEFFAPEREKKILQRLVRLNKGPLNEQALRAIFREIISATRLLQKGLSIAYWGPEGSFTHQAAVEKFGSMAEYIPEPSIQDVFREVGKGRADYGVVPIENSTEGVVNYTLDMFVDSPLKICAEIYLEISHYLMGKGKLEDVKCIYSNPQAIAQCRQWIRQNLPHAELIEVSTTSKGAELAARDTTGTTAAIGSKIAAEIYDLEILAHNIEDSASNITRFLIIGKNYSKQ